MRKLAIYDNGGETLDRYTIVNLSTKERDIFGSRFYTYEAIAASKLGLGVYLHIHCQRGKHLGKKIEFRELSEGLQLLLASEFGLTLNDQTSC